MEVLDRCAHELLKQYFRDGPGREVFYLGGGSALALADFQHRRSDDLDFFARDPNAVARFGEAFIPWGTAQGFAVEEDLVRRGSRFRRFFYRRADATVKLDVIADAPPFFGPVRDCLDFRCEDRRTLFASKIGTLVSREEVRDLVDAYFIFRHSGQDRAGLVRDAIEKTPGVNPVDIALRLLAFERLRVGEFLTGYMIRAVSEEELLEFCRTEAEILKGMYS